MTEIIQRILKGIGYSLSEAVSRLAFTNLHEDSAGNPTETEAAFIGRSWLAVGIATVVLLVFSVLVSLIGGPVGTLFSLLFGFATIAALLDFALITMLVAVAVGVVIPGNFTARVGLPMISMIWWVVALLVLLLVVPNVGSFWILPTLLVSLIAYYVAPVAHPARSWIGITAIVAVCAFLFSPDLIPSIIDRTVRETRSFGGELTQQLNCSDRPDHEDCQGWRETQRGGLAAARQRT